MYLLVFFIYKRFPRNLEICKILRFCNTAGESDGLGVGTSFCSQRTVVHSTATRACHTCHRNKNRIVFGLGCFFVFWVWPMPMIHTTLSLSLFQKAFTPQVPKICVNHPGILLLLDQQQVPTILLRQNNLPHD